ncbi:MAG: glycosyltransferase family 4 protein [Deltaproteobacteria bacterium]|nr:glycosyltransferase family 4 protein [Candidatus Zymogenaceae bacterium]
MKKRIEILHVITRMEEGGAPRVLLDLLGGLDRDRFSQTLAAGPAPEGTDLLHEAGRLPVEVHRIRRLGRSVAPLRDLSALIGLIDLIKDKRFDIIHTHTSKAGFLGRLAARLTGKRRVVYSPHGDIFSGYFPGYETVAYRWAERMAAPWCDKIVTLSDAGGREYLTRGIGTRRQFVTIPNGVDAAALSAAADRRGARGELGIGADDFVIACVGRLVRIKGYDVMAAAAPSIIAQVGGAQNVRFLVIGDGPERGALVSQVGRLGMKDRFSFLGFRTDIGRLLSGADLLAMPSRNEGLGMSILEAMALCLPVVASRVGGIPEAVTDGVTGILVSAEDPDDLAGACIGLIRDANRAREMGRAGKRSVETRFGVEGFIEKTARLYLDLMGETS